MKKLALILVALLAFGTVFAEDGVVDFSVSGDANLSWGYNLNSNTHGFSNGFNASLEITFVSEASVEAGGEGFYGEIKLSDFKAEAFTITAPTVSAKLTDGTVYATVYGVPSTSQSFASWTLIDGTTEVDTAKPATSGTFGTTLGVNMEGILSDLGFKVLSADDWDGNVNNDYYFGAVASLVLVEDLATLDADAFFDAAGFGGVAVKLSGSVDMLGYSLAADYTDNVDLGVGVDYTLFEDEDDNTSAVAADLYAEADFADLYAKVSFNDYETGLVNNLSTSNTFQLDNLLEASGTLAWAFDSDNYFLAAPGLKFIGNFGLGSDEVIDIEAGVELGADFTTINNTTITAKYITTDVETDNGKAFIEFKIAY
jgi:hypothetical protein